MTLTLRSASTTTATTKGSALSHAQMDANWLHALQSANSEFVQSGSGAIASTVSAALKLYVHTSQYATQGNYETARDALTGTFGVNNLDVSGTLTATGTATLAAVTATALTNSALTSGRIPYASTGGLLADSADLTFSGSTLTAHTLTVSTGNLTVSAGQVILANGTKAAPGVRFAGDTDTGIFFRTGNFFNVSVGGNEIIQIAASGVFEIGGTAASFGLSGFQTDAAGADAFISRLAANSFGCDSHFSPTAAVTNTRDLGVSGTNLWRTGYFGTSVVVGSAGWTVSATAATGLTAQGNARFAHGTSALATTATEGFLHLQSCAGAPTGTPATIPTGQIPMVYDSTNHRIYFYSGAWRSVAVA